MLVVFQYPQADRRGCNVVKARGRVPFGVFQYPQADRRGCNVGTDVGDQAYQIVSVSTSGSKGVQLDRNIVLRAETESFSIHKRIEGGATSKFTNLLALEGCFSIHKRIEGGATVLEVVHLEEDFVFQYPQADRRGCNYSPSFCIHSTQ